MLEALRSIIFNGLDVLVVFVFFLVILLVVTSLKLFESKKLYTHIFFLCLSIFLIMAVIFPLGLYFNIFGDRGFSSETQHWGEFGDFVGGTLNPIFAFSSFLALLWTIRVQTKQLELSTTELGETRVELRESRKAQEESSVALKGQLATLDIQAFEATFFSLLASLQKLGQSVESEKIKFKTEYLSHSYGKGVSTVTNLVYSSSKLNAYYAMCFDLFSSIGLLATKEYFHERLTLYYSLIGNLLDNLDCYVLVCVSQTKYGHESDQNNFRKIVDKYSLFKNGYTFNDDDRLFIALPGWTDGSVRVDVNSFGFSSKAFGV